MRSLKPFTIVLLGPVLVAAMVAAIVTIAIPNHRGPWDVVIIAVLGSIVGLLVFLPIAAGDALRSDYIRRHFNKFERWSALAMAAAFGHLVFRAMGDDNTLIAVSLLMLVAGFRVYLSSVAKRSAA